MPSKTLRQLLEIYKTNPGQLTPGELESIRKEVRRVRRKTAEGRAEYERQKARTAKRSRLSSAAGRDIGELPLVANPRRRGRAQKNFRYFAHTYFPSTFTLKWSPDHLKAIKKIEQAVLHGGLFALAMPRGSGKTSIAECAGMWAILNGHRDFVCLIGASEVHAGEMLDSIKTELEANELLAEDYPEIVTPIAKLEGLPNRCNGQLYDLERTHIGWTADEVVLPTIKLPDVKAWSRWKRADDLSFGSGAIIRVTGITGRIRGMKFKRPDGKAVRPSLVILDDPQTDAAARSLSQCATRERVLAGAVLGMAGPGKKISGIMPCTVIRPGDMADKILDREKHPDWNGERTKMVYAFPTDEKLWVEYGEVRAESLRRFGDIREATKFYRKHRQALDEGATIAWAERYNHDELSAIQHAMNLKLQDERAFFSEYQNDPMPEEEMADEGLLDSDQIAAKVNGLKRGAIPTTANHLTMFIDSHEKILFWIVAAFEDDFTGYVVDYGTYPDQKRPYFTLRNAQRTLRQVHRGTGMEGSIRAGIKTLAEKHLGREWQRDDGAMMRIRQCLMDSGWLPDVIHAARAESLHKTVMSPSLGRAVGAKNKPFAEYKKQSGDRVGHNWRIPRGRKTQLQRHVTYDTNYWKTFVHSRLNVALGDRGCLSLFGRDAEAHRCLADHLVAEYRTRTSGRGRTVDEWQQRPGTDNHWLDCLVGCVVAASMLGVALPGTGGKAAAKKPPIVMSKIKRRRR